MRQSEESTQQTALADGRDSEAPHFRAARLQTIVTPREPTRAKASGIARNLTTMLRGSEGRFVRHVMQAGMWLLGNK
jgi:hypothetical protein